MSHGSKYGSSVVIVQERQYRPSSNYTVGSSASRSSGTSTGYYTSTMDSSSSSRSPSASNPGVDWTGAYRNSHSGMSLSIKSSAIDANTAVEDGNVTTAQHNTRGKREVVIIHHNKQHADPDAPRSSERYRS
ncbi:hypothetical protein BR93DRAFT_734413 [Coniochaeta sp. PMI_546]|nr:hypothetical protein BR93DRAFT_734413 [Coniochaeta sp. PMI_546]